MVAPVDYKNNRSFFKTIYPKNGNNSVILTIFGGGGGGGIDARKEK